MTKQRNFTDLEYANRKRRTRRDEFLETMNEVIPWDEMTAMIAPYYPSGKRGRPPRGIEIMFRMYLLQSWFNLSDEGVEDAIYDSYAFRNFMGVTFETEEQVPDATTLCNFRKLIDENGIAKMFFESVRTFLDKHGKIMHGGTIVDATLIDAPISTKNETKSRDSEMSSVRKGCQWYFGERLFVGVDAGSGYIHSADVTAARVGEITNAHKLIRDDDEVFYGDAAYTGLEKREEIKGKSLKTYQIGDKNRRRMHGWDAYIEWQKSRVRSKVEYVFLIIKRIFGYRKVRYRGLGKNMTHGYTLCALANFYMLAQSGWRKAY